MDYKKILEDTDALIHGHFLLSSGLHSDSYIQCAKALKFPWYAEELGYGISVKISAYNPDCVVSPAIGGIIIGYEVSKHLNVPFLFAERTDDGTMRFRRDFDPSQFKRIAIVEDVITTGKSTKEVMELLHEYGAPTVCTASIANRGNLNEINGFPIKTLIELPLNNYKAEECPLCKDKVPLVKPGTRKFTIGL